MTIEFVALGLDHRHIYGMVENMQAVGGKCLGFWTIGTPNTLDGFQRRFPNIARFPTLEAALNTGADLALISAIPNDRSDLAIKSIRHGMDVMTDKPGCISRMQLDQIKEAVAETGRIWSVNFSERFEVPAVTKATQLVRAGAIGRVLHTAGLGPHRLNKSTRPDWFFQRDKYGGILVDIASHQIDQFMHFTQSAEAEITHAFVANYANPDSSGLQDFGEISLRSKHATGSIRVDWFTPHALPTWGDGRLTILGTDGYIELRKYTDVGGCAGTDHLILVNETRCEKIDASGAGLPYFEALASDIRNRTETAMSQEYCFKVMELALSAQQQAEAQLS
ncbi:MAG: Gfo/Idh/MocA family protein [Roseobacter sp.]